MIFKKKLFKSDIGDKISKQKAVNIPKKEEHFFNLNASKNTNDKKLRFIDSNEKLHVVTISYKSASEQWRIVGLSNKGQFFEKKMPKLMMF